MKCAPLLVCLAICALAQTAHASIEYQVIIKNAHERYTSSMNPDAAFPGINERFALIDINGGTLQSGDAVALRAANGKYLMAGHDDKAEFAYPWIAAWETWIIEGLDGAEIDSGDRFGLRGAHGNYLITGPDGGMGNVFPWLAAHETYTLYIQGSSDAANYVQRDERSEDLFWAAHEPQVLLETHRSILKWEGGALQLFDRNLCGGTDRRSCGNSARRWLSNPEGQDRFLSLTGQGDLAVLGMYGDMNGVIWTTHWSSNTQGALFRAASGHYLRADGGGGGGLAADAHVPDIHEKFELLFNLDAALASALKTHNGHFVVAEVNGDANANRSQIGSWEKFHIENNNDGTHSIYSIAHDRYLRAAGGGGGDARFDATVVGSHERFTMLVGDRLILENCTLSVANAEETLWSTGYDCDAVADPAPLGPAPYAKSYGNDNFGAGFSAQVGYQTPVNTFTRAFGAATAYARIFGHQMTIIGGAGEAVSAEGVYAANAELDVLGTSHAVSLDSEIETDLISPITRTFFDHRSTFMAGPVPVTVTGGATGTVGMQGSAVPGPDGFEVTARPYANLTGTASASVGVGCASAGISGTLTLLEIGFPATIALDGAARTVSLGADMELDSLRGSIDLNASYCVGSKSWELVNWAGISNDWALFSERTFTF